MTDHEKRILDEEDDLSAKLDRLRKFLGSATFKALSCDDQGLLRSQSLAMVQYLECLRQRIGAIK